MAHFTAGEPITAATLNLATEKIVARGRRVTASTTTTTEQSVMRIDDAQLYAGYLYRVVLNETGIDSSVANDVIRAIIRYTTDGSTPTTASTTLTIGQELQVNASQQATISCSAFYAPGASDVQFSALLTVARTTGTGSVGMLAGGGAPGPIDFYIENMGLDVGDTATEL